MLTKTKFDLKRVCCWYLCLLQRDFDAYGKCYQVMYSEKSVRVFFADWCSISLNYHEYNHPILCKEKNHMIKSKTKLRKKNICARNIKEKYVRN